MNKVLNWIKETVSGRSDSENYIDSVESLIDKGNFNKAIEICDKTLEEEIDVYQKSLILHRKASAFLYLGDNEQSISIMEQALNIISNEPETGDILLQKARLNYTLAGSYHDDTLKKEFYNKAKFLFVTILDNFPQIKKTDVWLNLAEIYDFFGNVEEAKEYYNLVIEADCSDSEKALSLMHIGDIEYTLKNFEAARRCYLKALDMKDTAFIKTELLLGLGNIQYELGNLDEAEKSLISAKKFKKQDHFSKDKTFLDIQIYRLLGMINYDKDKFLISLDYFEKGLKYIDKGGADSFFFLNSIGYCYFALNAYQKAKRCFQEVLESECSFDAEKDIARYGIQKTIFAENRNK